ncbi:MAG: glycoside hydrolase family 15 protein [Pseudomonadota bacterium]
MSEQNLRLGLIGNCIISALIDAHASIVWSCFPRFDGDPIFCRLLDGDRDRGFMGIDLDKFASTSRSYLENTAILRTRLTDEQGSGVDVIDFCPRFEQFDRMFRPTMIIRMIVPFGEAPRVRIKVRPLFQYGETIPVVTRGSNHIRYVDDTVSVRMTTNASLTYILDETWFHVDRPITMIVGPDESLRSPVMETGRDFLEKTTAYWRQTSGRLHIPFEWQDAVIRSAITLKLCSFEESGAIIASPTTSLPETHDQGRNWDYRFCWLRDAYFVVRALNRLGYIETMEEYLEYLGNIIALRDDGYLQPVYGIGLEQTLTESTIESLEGYRGNQPIRVGNQAYEHDQHDGYGSVILAVTQAFFDRRLRQPAGPTTYKRLEKLGEKAWEVHDVPDAGLWEFRTKAHVHTHSSVMCWAACDRLRRIGAHLGMEDRAKLWRDRADRIKANIMANAWSAEKNSFVASFDGDDLDACLLLLHEVGFLAADDPKFIGTVEAIGRELVHGPYVYRYVSADDFGRPENAFLTCSFWYIEALIAIGRIDEARKTFQHMLDQRNDLGLMSEHIDQETGELWGNFPQTYSHVGLITAAMRLSRNWDEIV